MGKVRKKRTADHVAYDGTDFVCHHCGERYKVAFGDGGIQAWEFTSLADGFEKEHQRCEKPKEVRCGFCHSPEHATEQHVNATCRTASDWPTCRDTGMSSEAIFTQMTGKNPNGNRAIQDRTDYPRDPADLGRCLRLLAAPWASGWRERLQEMARHGGEWARLSESWGELEAMYHEEYPSGKAPKTYELMRKLIEKKGG